MKILIMGSTGKNGGGLMVHYTMLVSALHKEGFEIFCISLNDEKKYFLKEVSANEIIIPHAPKSFFQKAVKYFKFKKAIREAKKFAPEIFIATGYGYAYAMLAKALPAKTFKLFQEVHFEAAADSLRMQMIESFDAVAVQTKGMTAPFLKNVSSKKPVASLPCFSKEYEGDDFEKMPSAKNQIRLAYFGRLAWNKGVQQFIEATAEIFKNEANLFFDIYGSGPEVKAIKQEIFSKNLQRKITLKGFYHDDKFPSIISLYHGIIIPSIATEGLPLILIEAMRFGRPVFATRTGAMPETALINKDGMMISEKEFSELAANLSIFINKIRREDYNPVNIHAVFKNYFSNKIFLAQWLQMLAGPEKYFTQKNIA